MFKPHSVEDGQAIVICAANPFGMVEASAVLAQSAAGKLPGITPASPCLIDVRTVRMARIPTMDFVTFFRERARRGIPSTHNPLACVCDVSGTFGMLRMFGILAELEGVRTEDRFFVSEDLDEAAAWLEDRADLRPGAAARLAAKADACRAEAERETTVLATKGQG